MNPPDFTLDKIKFATGSPTFEKAVDLYDKSLQMHLPVVIPPRPAFPDKVAQRQQESLWNGALINGNKWSKELQKKMEKYLEISETQQLLLTIYPLPNFTTVAE